MRYSNLLQQVNKSSNLDMMMELIMVNTFQKKMTFNNFIEKSKKLKIESIFFIFWKK